MPLLEIVKTCQLDEEKTHAQSQESLEHKLTRQTETFQSISLYSR